MNKEALSPWRMCNILLTTVSLLYPSTTPHAAETLNLLTWEQYLSEAVIQRWQAETGVRIQQVYFDSSDRRDEVLAKPDHLIDLTVTDPLGANRFGQPGHLETIDESMVPNLAHVPLNWRDRCGPYGVPYLWGTLGIAYRSDRLPEAPRSWADLLEPAHRDAPHIVMMEDHEDILVGPLIHLKQPINTANEVALKAAFELLQRQSHAVLSYQYVITSLPNSEYLDQVDLALVYSGDQRLLNDITGIDGDPWRYVVPSEGTLLWVDCLSVPATSRNKALAYRFLDFLNKPEIAALNTAELGVATANEAAIALLPEAVRQDPEIYPAEVILKNSQIYRIRPTEATQTRRRIISALVNAHDAR